MYSVTKATIEVLNGDDKVIANQHLDMVNDPVLCHTSAELEHLREEIARLSVDDGNRAKVYLSYQER